MSSIPEQVVPSEQDQVDVEKQDAPLHTNYKPPKQETEDELIENFTDVSRPHRSDMCSRCTIL